MITSNNGVNAMLDFATPSELRGDYSHAVDDYLTQILKIMHEQRASNLVQARFYFKKSHLKNKHKCSFTSLYKEVERRLGLKGWTISLDDNEGGGGVHYHRGCLTTHSKDSVGNRGQVDIDQVDTD